MVTWIVFVLPWIFVVVLALQLAKVYRHHRSPEQTTRGSLRALSFFVIMMASGFLIVNALSRSRWNASIETLTLALGSIGGPLGLLRALVHRRQVGPLLLAVRRSTHLLTFLTMIAGALILTGVLSGVAARLGAGEPIKKMLMAVSGLAIGPLVLLWSKVEIRRDGIICTPTFLRWEQLQSYEVAELNDSVSRVTLVLGKPRGRMARLSWPVLSAQLAAVSGFLSEHIQSLGQRAA